MNVLDRLAAAVIERQFKRDYSRLEASSMTYKLMKRLIQKGLDNGTLDVEATMLKLDVFLMADRITAEEYQELVEMMGGSGNE